MLLENIKDFNWYNDPQNVRFVEEGMLIEAKAHTDFWQNSDCNFAKDDGHLFAKSIEGDFILTVVCSFPGIKANAQCGLMARSDKQNWIKAGLYSPQADIPQLGVVSANQGSSDWSIVDLPPECKQIWLRLRRRGKDFIIWYSLDGENFRQVRMLHLPKIDNIISAGAFTCSPGNESFEFILQNIDIQT